MTSSVGNTGGASAALDWVNTFFFSQDSGCNREVLKTNGKAFKRMQHILVHTGRYSHLNWPNTGQKRNNLSGIGLKFQTWVTSF